MFLILFWNENRQARRSVLHFSLAYITVPFSTIFISSKRILSFILPNSSYSYAESGESSSSFSQRRFVQAANWYIQHVTRTCEQTLIDRNASISILSDEPISGIPSNFITLVFFLFSLS